MIESLQIVPDWTCFTLNNGTRLDVMVEMKGLDLYTFDQCREAATIAIIKNIPDSFFTNYPPA